MKSMLIYTSSYLKRVLHGDNLCSSQSFVTLLTKKKKLGQQKLGGKMTDFSSQTEVTYP